MVGNGWAEAVWKEEDILDAAERLGLAEFKGLPREEAQELAAGFLDGNEKYIQEAMITAGWNAIEALLGMDYTPGEPYGEYTDNDTNTQGSD